MITKMKANEDMIVNPIYEWSDTDVWEYIRSRSIEYNPMYDMGYHRVGCVGCPMATYHQKMKAFNDFPYVKKHYIEAFDEMCKARQDAGKINKGVWIDGKAVFDWWIEKNKYVVKGQMSLLEDTELLKQ